MKNEFYRSLGLGQAATRLLMAGCYCLFWRSINWLKNDFYSIKMSWAFAWLYCIWTDLWKYSRKRWTLLCPRRAYPYHERANLSVQNSLNFMLLEQCQISRMKMWMKLSREIHQDLFCLCRPSSKICCSRERLALAVISRFDKIITALASLDEAGSVWEVKMGKVTKIR